MHIDVADTTPPLLFLQFGVRALDHCIEALFSPYCNEVTETHAKASLERLDFFAIRKQAGHEPSRTFEDSI
jgi:alcohol dehydrogenase class IV